MNFIPFPGIEGFHNVVKAVTAYPHLCPTSVSYRGKIKLHGTNAGVRVDNGEVAAQSRTQIITPKSDNAGFATWVEARKDFFKDVGHHPKLPFYQRDPASVANIIAHRGAVPNSLTEYDFTIYGEWCGPGIMKGTAINQISNRIFAIFAVSIGNTPEVADMVTDPTAIAELLGPLPSDVFILPFYGETYTVDYTDVEGLRKTVDSINAVVAEIETGDPWVKETFGVDGIAEGIVYVPGAGQRIPRKQYSDLAFKAKGEKHKVNKTKEAVQIDPETLENIGAFVHMFATVARFEQGVTALSPDLSSTTAIDIKKIGSFLKWIGEDVLKESEDELEASGLEWADVQKSIQAAARNWYIQKAKTI